MDSKPWHSLEAQFAANLKLTRRPVAMTFLDREPAGIEAFKGTEPSGCSFWRLASEGRSFYTVPSDHFNCAVGSYTHNIALSPERVIETEQTLQMMFGVGYIRPEDVPGIPRLESRPLRWPTRRWARRPWLQAWFSFRCAPRPPCC